MAEITTSRLKLAYETYGQDTKGTVLLICGFSMQMVAWPQELIASLSDAGFQVVAYDNRDIGLSQRFHDAGTPEPLKLAARRFVGLGPEPVYTLDDMADDAISLLDALGVERAHVVGMSMGGMIAQNVAIRYPERVASLTSWSSMPGGRSDLVIHPRMMKLMLTPPPKTLEERIEWTVGFWKTISSPAFPTPEEEVRANVMRSIERSTDTRGLGRQLGAIVASPSRVPTLTRVKAPALVIHGKQDPLVPFRGGKRTAQALREADFFAVDGYGHDLPRQLMPRIARRIAENARRAR